VKVFFTGMIDKIGRNAAVTCITQPLWAIPFYLYNSYAALYMINQGITEGQVGVVNSVSFIVKAAAAVFAGYIINRLGRKTSIIMFDVFSWVIPYFLWSIATNYWQFIAASLFSGLGIVNTIAWNCILVEDTRPEHRIFVFNFNEIIIIIAGFLTPVSGLLISKFTLVPAIRGVCVFGLICMVTLEIVRFFLLKETGIGREKMLEAKSIKTNVRLFTGFWKTAGFIVRNRLLTVLFVLSIAVNFCFIINNLYYFPYLTSHLKYNQAGVSLFPSLTSVVSLLMLFFIIPRIKDRDKFLLAGFLLYFVGALILIFAPGGLIKVSIIMVLTNVVFWAVSRTITNILLSTRIANAVDDHARADIMSFYNIFSIVCMFPAGIIGGSLYEISPRGPFYFISVVYLIGFAAFFLLLQIGRRKEAADKLGESI